MPGREHFSGLGGYEGISFNTFDVFTQQWVRTWVDNQGQRLFLTGGLVDGAMVLRGIKRTVDGQEIVVRVSWTPVSADEVIQTWSFSRNSAKTGRWRRRCGTPGELRHQASALDLSAWCLVLSA